MNSKEQSGSHEQLAARLNGFDQPTVWHVFTPLANEYKAVNLGQGTLKTFTCFLFICHMK
jgi:hypothetical protein